MFQAAMVTRMAESLQQIHQDGGVDEDRTAALPPQGTKIAPAMYFSKTSVVLWTPLDNVVRHPASLHDSNPRSVQPSVCIGDRWQGGGSGTQEIVHFQRM